MDRFARWITRHPKVVLVLAVLLLIPSALGFLSTGVNYDILSYLPEDLDSVQGMQVLDETFQLAASSFVIVENMSVKDTAALREQIVQVEGVTNAVWVYDILDAGIPQSMIPDALRDVLYSEDGNAALMLVQHEHASASEETMAAVEEMRTLLNRQCFMSGMSALMTDMRTMADEQAPIFIALAIAFALLVLTCTMESWLQPLVLLAALTLAVIYNMGTNFFLGDISFITQSIAAILQLAVTMDYSVFLIDRYEEECRHTADRRDAMAKAISSTFLSLAGSSMTTVFGFLALCFMQLTLGFDIGFVMAKGVVLGVLTVVIVLPAMLLLLDKPLHKYRHRSLVPSFQWLTGFVVKHKKALVIVFLVLFIPAWFAQSRVEMYYNMDRSIPEDTPSIVGLNKMKDDFGMAATHFLLVDEDLPAKDMMRMIGEVESVEGVTNVLGLSSIIGPGIPSSMIPQELREIVQKDGTQLLMVNTDYGTATPEIARQIGAVEDIVKTYDPGGLVTGEGVLYNDLITVTDRDFMVTSILSVAAILLLIGIVFQSLSIPVLLVASIELAIFINLGISYLAGETIPFIAPTVISCVQLGATVDYAILLTTRFREELRAGKKKTQAMRDASAASNRSIMQSALVFFFATFGVYLFCDMELIKSICALLARGSIISMLVSMLLLPPLLLASEKLIAKTTRHWRTAKRKEAVL